MRYEILRESSKIVVTHQDNLLVAVPVKEK